MTYRLIGKDELRSFKIVCGLTPGYRQEDPYIIGGEILTFRDEVIEIHARWMEKRISNNLPYLTGMFRIDQLSYSYQIQDEVRHHREPVLVFYGDASPLYHKEVMSPAIDYMLIELANLFGEHLQQERVYVSSGDYTWVLEKEET